VQKHYKKERLMPSIIDSFDVSNPEVFAALANTRTYQQYLSTLRDLKAGICIFCDLKKCKHQPFLEKGNWAAKLSDMPYINTEHHIIVVYTGGHLEDWGKLTRKENADFMEIKNEIHRMFNIEGSSAVERRGAIRRHAGTIKHLHSHIMVVALDEQGFAVGELRAYFAKSRKELAQCRKMLELFERVRTGNTAGVRNGFVVFDGCNYLTKDGTLKECNTPSEADLLNFTLDEIRVMCKGKTGLKYYEVMETDETGIIIKDGYFNL